MAGPSVLHESLNTYSAASGSVTLPNTPTVGNLLVVITSQGAAASGETISDNQGTPNTWTKQCSAATTADNVISIWTAPVVHTGAGFAVTYSGMGTVAVGYLEIIEVTGQSSSTPVDGTPQASNNSSTAITAISQPVGSASIANDLGILAIAPNSSETITWTAPMAALDGSNGQAQPLWVGSGTITGTGSATLAASMSSSSKVANAGILITATIPPPAYPLPTQLYIMP